MFLLVFFFVEQSNILRPFMCFIPDTLLSLLLCFFLAAWDTSFLSVSEILNQHSTPTESNRSTISFTHRWGHLYYKFIWHSPKFNKLHQWNAMLMLLLCWFCCHFNDIFINYKIHFVSLIHTQNNIWRFFPISSCSSFEKELKKKRNT